MMKYEDLQLANNLESLDLLVKPIDFIKYKDVKFDKMCKNMDTVYQVAQKNPLDQEKTYVLLSRYLLLHEIFLKIHPDKKFAELRFGSQPKRAERQLEEVKKSLQERYEAKKETIVPDQVPQPSPVTSVKKKRIFEEQFISCSQLYSALQDKNINILLVDSRRSNDYLKSSIIAPNCINVPEECIKIGLSAHKLGENLNPETRHMWEQRDAYSVLVLLDWNSSSDDHPLSPSLRELRSALVDWDPNKKYNEPPVILNGGYLEFLRGYPSQCRNPHVMLSKMDNELDELLDIDIIEYPTESDSTAHVMGLANTSGIKPMETDDDDDNETSRDSLIVENKKLALDSQEITSKLISAEREWKDLNEKSKIETDLNEIAELRAQEDKVQENISTLEKALEEVTNKKDKSKENFDLYAKFDPENETFDSRELKEIIDFEENENDKSKILDAIAEERCKALRQARAVKPKPGERPLRLPTHPRPTVNRTTKPSNQLKISSSLIGSLETTPGHVGLKNIRNTCYMNTVVQCVRNIPAIMELFCGGIYARCEIRSPAAIILETAYLVRYLWSRAVKYIEPSDFYRKVCTLEPSYGLGNHEDCMEFFLFLLNHLSEDCYYEAERPTIMTPKQKAWFNQFQGKSSIFVDLFYHQIRIRQFCTTCPMNTYKFEIESTFMLSVPDHDFNVENLMDEYMADFVIPEHVCSKCKKPVTNKKNICYQPQIVVIVLKRYKQVTHNGAPTIRKIESRGYFPKNNFKLGDCAYDLNSIAIHSGDMNHGHYTAACLTQKGWYEFNDEIVRPININDDSIRTKACAFFYSMCDDSRRRL